MDIMQKARILGEAGRYDSCGPKQCEIRVNNNLGGLYHAKSENPDCIMLKTLMNNSCGLDCRYCPNAAGCEQRKKVAYKPKELSKVFGALRKSHGVHGLFLSSGVAGNPEKATEKMIDAVRKVRKDFRGYVHMKVLPGTSYDKIKEMALMSNRMSVNIEAPNKSVLNELSTTKDLRKDILRRQGWMKKLGVNQTTQMIVNEYSTDKDVLRMTNWEYQEMKLRRVYFSAFSPVKGTPMEKNEAESKQREARLYNVDFLMRGYGFNVKEFNKVMNSGMLPREDPKIALAKANFSGRVDINEASYEELIRIPGIGLKTARRIQNMKVKRFEDLHKLGGWVERAKPFISVEGVRQMSLGEY
jgi:predicted DNA-binding helix-hairpin-helix protein